MTDELRADEFDLMLSTLRYVLGAGQAKNGEKARDHYNAIINSIASRAERTEDSDVRLACAAVKRAALAQPPAPTAQPAESTTGQPLRSICWANCPCRKAAQPVQQPTAQPAARLLTWCGPAHMSIPHGGVAARTYAEFPESSAAPQNPNAYWRNGDPLFSQPVQQPGAEPLYRQIGALLVDAPTPPDEWPEDADYALGHLAGIAFGHAPSEEIGHCVKLVSDAQAAPAQRQPLTPARVMEIAATLRPMEGHAGQSGDLDVLDFARAIQEELGITAAPAAQKGEKL